MKNNTKKIILWGTGKIGQTVLSHISDFDDICKIIAVIDSDNNKWGKSIFSFVVQTPSILLELNFDKIVISSSQYYEEIKKQIQEQFHIEDKFIEDSTYFAKEKLLLEYKETGDKEIKEILEYLKSNKVEVFNYSFAKKYEELSAKVEYDKSADLYYVWYEDKRLYISRKFDSKEKVLAYYRSILLEQDEKSPHRYLDKNFQINTGDVVLDIGVAEGNFSLEVIDEVSKLYIVETDKGWIEALKYTFKDYLDKIVFIPKFATDHTEGEMIALDDVITEEVNFIKMDVEGEEVKALNGLRETISSSQNVKCAICAYHNDNDEMLVKEYASQLGMKSSVTNGYMYFPVGNKQKYQAPQLRRGIVRMWKGN